MGNIALTTVLPAAALVLVMVLAGPAAAAEQLVVPVDPYPPWKLVDLNTWEVDPRSIDVRLTQALLAAYNRTYGTVLAADYQGYPWKRCLEMMRAGAADLISGVLKRPERDEYMIFLEPPYKTTSTKVFYVRQGSGVRIRRYEDLYGLRLGVQAGVSYFDPFDSDPRLLKDEVGEDLFNFKKLETGRVDAVISTETQADYLIASHGFQGRFAKARYRIDSVLPVYFAISRKSPYAAQAARFAAVVARLAAEGVFAGLIDDYFAALRAGRSTIYTR